MKRLLAYLTQPGTLAALVFIVLLAGTGAFFWQDGGKWAVIAGALVVAIFLIGSYSSSNNKKP